MVNTFPLCLHKIFEVITMDFEAYKISEHNWQMYILNGNHRIWLASFNKLSTLLNYYIFCHNLSNDTILFTGERLNDVEKCVLVDEAKEWHISIKKIG